MAACEKCWDDAFDRTMYDSSKSQTEHYQDILEERKDEPCSPRDQAGQFWDEENQCNRLDMEE